MIENYKRWKEVKLHYSQLDADNKKLVDKALEHFDDFIEDLLLEQEFHLGTSRFLREYRKHYDLDQIKRNPDKHHPVINSRKDGMVTMKHAHNEILRKQKAEDFKNKSRIKKLVNREAM
ncbi:hypothetical protein LJ038_004909 [Salmonella enterica]|nr:hypothetical protein [Salmonella enterica]EIK2976418.1 hypothetical protein [Salmonella enterica]